MGRLVFGSGVACAALLAACNMLSGADSLTAEADALEQPQVSAPKADASSGATGSSGSSGTSTRPHDPPADTDGGMTSLPPDEGGIDAASEAAAALPTFDDPFARPDGLLGNGWISKTSGAFMLVGGGAQQSANGIYRNLFNSRPASEDALDVLVQVTVTFPVATADPGLFARIQPGSDVVNHFVGYSVYPDGANDLYVSRDDGNVFVDQGSSVISPPLVVGQSYRLSLQVTGTNPVHLVGTLSQLDGTVLATITANDASIKRIATPGSVGFGSSVSVGGRWDDFKRITLP
jgi:hypothetical protein